MSWLVSHAEPTKFEHALRTPHKHTPLPLLNQSLAFWARFSVQLDPLVRRLPTTFALLKPSIEQLAVNRLVSLF
jgi:hypothetical protein